MPRFPRDRSSIPAAHAIGDLEPNGLRRVVCVFRVNSTIEDGSELVFQAALVTDQTPLVASNIERLFVRSRPELQNSATFVTIAAPSAPRPGDAITVRGVVRNTGSSSAHDVIVVLPAPDHTTYVARSARIDGRIVAGTEGEAFDYDSSAVVSERSRSRRNQWLSSIKRRLTRRSATGPASKRSAPSARAKHRSFNHVGRDRRQLAGRLRGRRDRTDRY